MAVKEWMNCISSYRVGRQCNARGLSGKWDMTHPPLVLRLEISTRSVKVLSECKVYRRDDFSESIW